MRHLPEKWNNIMQIYTYRSNFEVHYIINTLEQNYVFFRENAKCHNEHVEVNHEEKNNKVNEGLSPIYYIILYI